MIRSPIGEIHLRIPTEAEAIAFEDKHRAARRTQDDDASGSVYDNGLDEVLACVTSHKVAQLHPSDGGLLDEAPALFDTLIAEFRALGGGGIKVEDCSEAITEEFAKSFGKKAVGLSYAGERLVVRKLTWAEYNAFASERTESNTWHLLAKYARRCVVSRSPEEVKVLCERYPYAAMTVGAKLYNLAQGAVDSSLGKSETA